MKVKYNRTSTIEQEGKRFESDPTEYDLTLFDKGVSGTVPFSERAKGKQLLKLLREGKLTEVVFEELTRIGRNANDTREVLSLLKENRVRVCIRNYSLCSTNDKGEENPMFALITNILADISEMERNNILERTKQGREVYIANGGYIGRPIGTEERTKDFLSKHQDIIELLEEGKSIRKISEYTKKSTATIQKVKKALV